MKNIAKIFGQLRNKNVRRVVILIILILALVGGSFIYLKRQGRVFIDDSLISAPIINITAPSPGSLNQMAVTENQAVKNGDLLAVVGTQPVRAQTDGIIIQASKQLGSTIAPPTTVVEMINPDDFRVVGTIDENKGLRDIRVGQVASFTIDAFPGQTFWGYVDEVAPTAKQTELAFSISNERPTQQFNVYVRFDSQKYSQIKNGMSAKLAVYTKTN